MVTGECIGAIAMTEPGAGSDLQGVKTTAVKQGDHYVLNGSKTFITNGQNADIVIVVAKTDPSKGAKGISLFVVDCDSEGFEKGTNLKKVGMKAQDTSELFFQDVKVPAENLLGEEGMGFIYLMKELPQERLGRHRWPGHGRIGLEQTLDYVKERKAFGKSIADFQNTQFKIAEMHTKLAVARVYVDRCLELHLKKELDIPTAAAGKYYITDLQCEVIDECLQLHGGYGYMWEYPIARMFADSRVQRIYGGTNEIMKTIIAKAVLADWIPVSANAEKGCFGSPFLWANDDLAADAADILNSLQFLQKRCLTVKVMHRVNVAACTRRCIRSNGPRIGLARTIPF